MIKSRFQICSGLGHTLKQTGSWSDDTSMSLCALDVLAEDKCDLDLIMVNFGRWYYNDEFTPTGELFDVGNACSYAIDNYFAFHKPIGECALSDEGSNGNGSLMRIHPFVLYLYAKEKSLTADGIDLIFRACAMTHAHMRAKIGCGIYAFILMEMLKHPCIESVYQGLTKAKKAFEQEPELVHYSRIFDEGFAELPRDEIKSGGYIVDTLEASLWCQLTSSSYREYVLRAVNLGEDTDTVAAIAGGLAGALYGYNSIPDEWLETLKRRDYIEEMCDRAFEHWCKKI